jgi:hypothetical protein
MIHEMRIGMKQGASDFGAGTTPRRRLRTVAVFAACGLLAGCSSIGLSGGSSGEGGAMSDRFAQLFGSNSQPAGTPVQQQQQAADVDCPGVDVKRGAATLAVGLPGKPAQGQDLRYQGTISSTARECAISGGNVMAKVGIQGRIIAGPAGAPPSVTVPMRIAVVHEGPVPKTIFTKLYQTSVTMPPGEPYAAYSLVVEDIVYPVPAGRASESYVFYVGFDTEGQKPAAQKPARKKSPPSR